MKECFFYCLLFLFVCFDFKMFLKNISVEKMRQELAGVIILTFFGGGGWNLCWLLKKVFSSLRTTGLQD